MREFSPAQLKTHLQTAQPLLLDVREPWEFDICHIEGSRLMPMGRVSVDYHELDPGQEIVMICHHGIRSRQIGYYLESRGFDRIINLSTGVEGWAHDVDPAMPVY